MHHLSIKQMIEGLESKSFSSEELVKHYLNRMAAQADLNCYVTTTEEAALSEAKLSDKARAKGEHSLLSGLPIAHKDIFCTSGVKTTCGSKMLDNFIAPYDATVVSKLKEQGMVTLGKTNMDEFAMGSSNETSYYGTVKNPWNTSCVAGGSSGGSAAAVAAGLAPIATGTDTGGSIRQPASFCGLTGLKPTYGLCSRYGMIAFASSLDQAGLIANSAEDIAWILGPMSGFDEKDSTSLDVTIPDYRKALTGDIKGLKIGVPKEFFNHGMDANVEKSIQQAVAQYESLGAKIIPVSLPHIGYSVPVYYVIAPAECSSNLARYDGVRFGYRCEKPENLLDLYKRSRDEGFGDEVKRRIMMGTYALSSGYFDAYYIKAQKIRRLIRQDFLDTFKTVDLIIGPTVPEVAFEFGAKSNDPVSMYLSDIYTIAVNLAGLPAMSIPCGFANDMPVGLQLIGPDLSEEKLLNSAFSYQLATDWHQKKPACFD